MITAYHRTLKDNKLQPVDDVTRRGVWVHAENLTNDDIALLVEKLSLDEGLLTDAQDFFEVPRFEVEDGISYFFTRHMARSSDDDEIGTSPILIAIGSTFILTVTHGNQSFIKQIVEKKQPVTTQKSKLFIQLIFEINKRYTNALTDIRREVRKSRRNLQDIRNKDIARFVALEDTLTDFISALLPTNTALKTFLSGNNLELFEEDLDLVEDVQLSNEQLIESARSIEHTIQTIRSTYSAIITNDLNQVIKMLTALTIVLTIPTMVSSLFGMNVPVPFGDHPLAFFGIVILTALLAATIAWFFSRRDWI